MGTADDNSKLCGCNGNCNGDCGKNVPATRRLLPRSTKKIISKAVLKWGEIVVDENGCIYIGDGCTEGGKPIGQVPCATTEIKGTVELANNDEAVAGTDDTRALTPASAKALLSSLSLSTDGGDVVLSCGGTEIARTTAPAGSGDTVTLNKDDSGNLASISVNGGTPCPIPSGGGGGGGEVTTAAVCAALAGLPLDVGTVSSDPSSFGLPFIGLPNTGQEGVCVLQRPTDGG